MPKLLTRIVAFLLVSALLADSSFAISLSNEPSLSNQIIHSQYCTKFEQEALSALLAFFPKPNRKFTALIFHQIAPQTIRSSVLTRLTTFAISSNIPYLSYSVGWLSMNRKQTQETIKILDEVKTALLEMNDWPPHIRERITQTQLWVMDKADTHGMILYGVKGRPVIVLNSDLVSKMSRAQLIYVLGHELAHPWFLEKQLTHKPGWFTVFPDAHNWMQTSELEDLADMVGILALRTLLPNEQVASLGKFFRQPLHTTTTKVRAPRFSLPTPLYRQGFPTYSDRDPHRSIDNRLRF